MKSMPVIMAATLLVDVAGIIDSNPQPMLLKIVTNRDVHVLRIAMYHVLA